MRKTAIVLSALLALSGCSYSEPKPYYAIDGDTIAVGQRSQHLAHIRLLRIDAPELPGHPCKDRRNQRFRWNLYRTSCNDTDPAMAYAAKRKLQDILDMRGGLLRCVDQGSDIYHRRLAECYVNGRNVSDAMLLSGLVYPYRYHR